MNDQRPDRVSVIDPLTPAINRVKLILFEPFDLGKWIIIAFCAWLAFLGSGGGGPQGNYSIGDRDNTEEALNAAKEFILENLYWIVPVVVFLVILGIVLWILFTWLSSRGRFMFLHCVAGNKAEVKIPWSKFRQHANSLFVFRIVLDLVGFVVIIVPVIFMILLILMMVSAGAPALWPILGVVFLVLSIIAIAICLGLVGVFTTDFVVPIMFLQTVSIRAAWREFITILSINKARFTLYILFQIVIGIVLMAIVLISVCCTCCCLACVSLIPIIGTVPFLPLIIFERSYSLYYLRQYGPQFDVFDIVNSQQELPESSY